MFSNGKWNKNVSTVGELISELSLIDPDMPIQQGFSDSVDIVIFNRDQDDRHIEFEDGETWCNDDEPDDAE